MNRTRRNGTTLVELLVVIVVFLIGILAILQIFPGGFKVLQNTRSMAVARQLARAEMERSKSYADTMAEMILDVRYQLGAGFVDIFTDANHFSTDLGHGGEGMDVNGHVISGGNDIGYWPYVSGPNRIRRIIGEGGRVPAPRQVGTEFGGLMLLQFAPIAYDPAYPTLLQIYGNDMVRREGEPGFRARDWEYFVEEPEDQFAKVWVPRGTVRPRLYRLSFSAWINNGGTVSRRSIVDTTLAAPANASGGWEPFDLAAYAALQPGETFLGAEFESIRVARAFEMVNVFNNGEPYEYKLLDARLGVILFNPAGYNFQEVRPGRRLPLVARANYDVFDWRIIRDEFRITSVLPLQQRLNLNSLKVGGMFGVDGLIYNGIDVPVADGSGGTETRDILLLDMETGGVYTKDSFSIDKSLGLITYNDSNAGAAGLQMRLILPGQTVPIEADASGRAVRALYQGNGEWSVQVMKAPSQYTITYAAPGVAQYYVGGSAAAGGSTTRIYFPVIDVGRTVVVGEIWYRDGGGSLHSLKDQDFVIQNVPTDPLGPYIDITTADPNAAAFDYSYGFAVRRVKGASLAVRVLWNPNAFRLTGNAAENNQRFDRWQQDYRRTTVETFLSRGEN